jgi:hypothetical protein
VSSKERGSREVQLAAPRVRADSRPRGLREGDLVIRALVRARLLGIQLLTLDAGVVVGTADTRHTRVLASPVLPAPVADGPAEPSGLDRTRPGQQVGPGLSRAIDLLEQGVRTLERARER